MIEAYITNLGRYNEGYLDGEYLKLPATMEDVQALFSRIKVDGIMYEEVFITDYAVDVSVFGVKRHLGEYESINELNYLATLLGEMDKWDLEKFEAAVALGAHVGSVQELINLTQNLECYEYYPGVDDYDDLGRYLIDELDYEQIPEHLQDYFDYSSYAETYVCNEGGEFVNGGFVFCNDVTFQEHYTGRADLPDEHKIFAYPPQEKSIKQALANFQQMISEAPAAQSPEKLTPAKAGR